MNQNPIILQVLPSLKMGGVERCVIETAAALKRAGIENYVVSKGGPLVAELEQLGVEHISLPVHSKNPIVMMGAIKSLIKVVREKKITLIHVASRAPAWVVKFVSQKTGVPFITTFHAAYGIKPKWFKIPYNAVMVSGQKVIAVSDFIKKHIVEHYHVDADKIITIYNGIDVKWFNPENVSEARVGALRESYGVPKGEKVIILPARRTRLKGHLLLLEALLQIQNQRLFVLFVGANQKKTDYTAELEEKIKGLPKNITVKMVESCADMPALYMMGDVILNTSCVPESFGLTIAEAQGLGRMVVAFAHGGAIELIKDNENGFLVPICDVKALAKVIERVLNLPQGEKERISQNAIQSVRDHFSVQKMGEQLISLYRKESL